MTWAGLAIGVHLLGVTWWLGGLAFVTLVFLPALRADCADNRSALLHSIERRFAPQARVALVLVGLSGGYLLWDSGLWRALTHAGFWWLHAMICYWLIFALLLFVIEPLGVLQRRMLNSNNPSHGWRRFHALHAVLLGLGVIVIIAGAAGSHGY